MASAELNPLKPAWRGWLHAGMTPVVLLAGILLVILAPAGPGRLGAAVWLAGSLVLFGTSAVYHRGRWTPTVRSGCNAPTTPTSSCSSPPLTLPWRSPCWRGSQRALLLSLVWGIAAAGVALTLLWPGRPRWLDVALAVPMGWVALGWLGAFWAAGGRRW